MYIAKIVVKCTKFENENEVEGVQSDAMFGGRHDPASLPDGMEFRNHDGWVEAGK